MKTEEGVANVRAAINALTANGATQTYAGMDMAKNILSKAKTANSNRQQVVILFTDGDTDSSQQSVYKLANSMKKNGVLIYTVGLFKDADQTEGTTSNKKDDNNLFLNKVSNNSIEYAKQGSKPSTKTDKSYYLPAQDAASLSAVFAQISKEVSKLDLKVDSKAVLQDTLSGYFTFEADDNAKGSITVQTAAFEGIDANGQMQWGTPENAIGTTVEVTGKKITVTGFDYGSLKNLVTVHESSTPKYTGKKLIVTIPIKPDTTSDVTWKAGSNLYDTNVTTDNDKAGLGNYGYKDKQGTLSTTLPTSPKAPVTGYTVSYVVTGGDSTCPTVAAEDNNKVYIEGQKYNVLESLTDTTGKWSFTGWKANESYSGDDVSGEKIMGTANVTYYGKWENATATVNLASYVKKTLNATSLPEGYEEIFKAKIVEGEDLTASTAKTIETDKFTASEFSSTTSVTKAFKELNVILSVGTHTFTVAEIEPAAADKKAGISYNTASQTFTLNVVEGGPNPTIEFGKMENGQFVKDTTKSCVTITNTYAPGSIDFSLTGKFQKTLNSNTADVPVAGKEFTLTIKKGEDVVASGKAGFTTLTDNNGTYTDTKSFFGANDKLPLDKAGTYTYTVQEVVPNPAVKGMKYDDTAYTLTITVADNQAGALEVTKAEITGGVYTIENPLNLLSDDSKLTITNTFTAAKLPLNPPTDPTDPAHGTAKIVKNLKSDDTEKSFDFEASITVTTDPSHNILPAYGEAKNVKNNDSSAQKAPFSGFGTLVFNTTGEYTFTIKETVPADADKVPGMTYDETEHTMVVIVAAIDNKHKLAVSSVTIDGKDINFSKNEPWVTFNNEYKTPSTGNVEKKTVRDSMTSGSNRTINDDILSQLYAKHMDVPSNDLKLVVDKNTDNVTLAYEVSIVGDATAEAIVEDEGATYVTSADVTGVTVDATDPAKVKVTFTEAATAKLYYVKTFTRENGKFATAKNVVTVNDGEPIPSDETTITDKDPGSFDFSGIIQKELKLTGSKSFTGAEFEATLTLKDFKQVVPFNSMLTTYADEHVEAWPEGWSRTLVAKFDTTAVDGSTTNFLTTDGNHLFLDFPAAGTYTFELQETNKTCTNVTYDDTVYTVVVEVAADNQDSNKLVVTRIDALYTDEDGNVAEKVIYISGETKSDVVTFVNTVDTGKDDYYPIIIPTIINKDTGMLNKTDHFAYVIGYPDGTVHPNGQITRAEVATIFFRLLRDEVRDGAFTTSNTYSDVAYGKWYNNPISTMSALGIITGYPDGTFKPNKPITRAEFAAIAARFDETQSGKSATFSDVIGHWAAKEIGIAYYNDWIKGYPDGTFKPDQNITRAEAMTLINRVLERKPESPADLLTNMNKWTDNMDTSKWYYLDVQEATNSHGYTRKTFNYELWRQMLPDPDWSRYER
ncbi:MAG: S-layer homology domain-containing protein [Clostridiales bacterium]|nr:S-layer homology domain-containing protein [Clostridiales bacterium]